MPDLAAAAFRYENSLVGAALCLVCGVWPLWGVGVRCHHTDNWENFIEFAFVTP